VCLDILVETTHSEQFENYLMLHASFVTHNMGRKWQLLLQKNSDERFNLKKCFLEILLFPNTKLLQCRTWKSNKHLKLQI